MARREEQTPPIERARRLVSDHHLVCHGHDDDDHDRDVDDYDDEEEDVPIDRSVIPSSGEIQTKGLVHIVLQISKAARYKTKSYNFQIVIFDRKNLECGRGARARAEARRVGFCHLNHF